MGLIKANNFWRRICYDCDGMFDWGSTDMG